MEFNALLGERLKGSSSKMDKLANRSKQGNLSSFSGVFKLSEVTEEEKNEIKEILLSHTDKNYDITSDLSKLITLTSEVKAINNQAIILHGERIKNAQTILKEYKDGAFTSWLIKTYGNRQTPYNFLQYFEFFTSLTKTLQETIEKMPKQVIYSLSSRKIDQKQKEKFIKEYQGESKTELLERLRTVYPLSKQDRRQGSPVNAIVASLNKISTTLKKKSFTTTRFEKHAILELLNDIRKSL